MCAERNRIGRLESQSLIVSPARFRQIAGVNAGDCAENMMAWIMRIEVYQPVIAVDCFFGLAEPDERLRKTALVYDAGRLDFDGAFQPLER